MVRQTKEFRFGASRNSMLRSMRRIKQGQLSRLISTRLCAADFCLIGLRFVGPEDRLVFRWLHLTLPKLNTEAMKAHTGFKAAAMQIARREGIPVERANRILASAGRKASIGAKRRNPRLRRVRGGY